MKFKNSVFFAFLLCSLFITSCQEKMNMSDNDDVLSLRGRAEMNPDAEILNSEEFKVLVQNHKKATEGLSLSNKDMKSFLDKMDKEKRKSLLKRAIEQGKQYMEYLDLHQVEASKNQIDIKKLEKSFFDADVLAYRNRLKSLKQKHVDIYLKELPKLRQALKRKFPNLSKDRITILMKKNI